jgi:hypothetical protein
LSWCNNSSASSGTADTRLYRDDANKLALRNGGTSGTPVPQTFNQYEYWATASDYSRISLSQSSAYFFLQTQAAGSGTKRGLILRGSGTNSASLALHADQLFFGTSAADYWTMSSSGHFLAGTDNLYDIGASGATRPRNVYVANSTTSSGFFTGTITGVYGTTGSGPSMRFSGNNIVLHNNDSTQNNFDRLQFGGTTSSFPALKRSSTTLQARLADDSAFAPVQGKLTTDTAYTAGAPTATGYLVVYDSAGTAYKIPALAV